MRVTKVRGQACSFVTSSGLEVVPFIEWPAGVAQRKRAGLWIGRSGFESRAYPHRMWAL